MWEPRRVDLDAMEAVRGMGSAKRCRSYQGCARLLEMAGRVLVLQKGGRGIRASPGTLRHGG